MSESVSAGNASSVSANSGSADVTPSTGHQNAQAQSSQGHTQNQGKEIIPTHGSKDAAKASEAKKPASQTDSGQDEFEEIALGSVKGKVPKAIAQAIKNFERGFQSKAQKAAEMEKMVSLAKENPREFFKQTGKNIHEFAEQVLADRFEELTMSPEQKQAREEKAELERLRAVDKASKQDLIKQLEMLGDQIPKDIEKYPKEEIQRYVEHRRQQYQQSTSELDNEIGQAFTESGHTPDKYTVAKVAFELSSAFKQGKNLSAKEALARVTKGADDGLRERLSKMDGKRIHELLGDNIIDLIRKHDLERVTEQSASQFGQPNQGQGSTPSSQGTKKEYLNQAEWRKRMGL